MAGFKFSKFFGLSDEDEYDDYNEHEYVEDEYTEPEKGVNSVNESRYTSASESQRKPNQPEQKIVALNGGQPVQQSKIIVFEPRVYSEVQEIADHLLNFQSVIVNFSSIDEEQAKRVVDFLTGTVYAANGDIQRIGDEIFLCTPANVEINTTLTDSLRGRNLF